MVGSRSSLIRHNVDCAMSRNAVQGVAVHCFAWIALHLLFWGSLRCNSTSSTWNNALFSEEKGDTGQACGQGEQVQGRCRAGAGVAVDCLCSFYVLDTSGRRNGRGMGGEAGKAGRATRCLRHRMQVQCSRCRCSVCQGAAGSDALLSLDLDREGRRKVGGGIPSPW